MDSPRLCIHEIMKGNPMFLSLSISLLFFLPAFSLDKEREEKRSFQTVEEEIRENQEAFFLFNLNRKSFKFLRGSLS